MAEEAKTEDDRISELNSLTLNEARDGLLAFLYKHPDDWDRFMRSLERRRDAGPSR